MGSTSEIKRLQSCINDLVSVLALPAIWSGGESSHILDTLLDTLVTMLRLDFAYARLNPSDGPRIEAVRLADHRHSSIQSQPFGQALDRWLSGDQNGSRLVVPHPVEDGEVSIVTFSLGLQQQGDILVAGSQRADFPTEVERLLLRVAANQAGIGLQEARRSGDQKRIAVMLEQRVAERTRRLTALNEQLRHSEAYLAEAQRLSHTGSFGWRPSTDEIIWSEETFRIFQYDRTTIPSVGLVLKRVHPEDVVFVQQTIERASQDGNNFDLEHRLLMPNGSVKHLHVVARALSNESGTMEFVGAVMDVTAGKRTEQTLREREAYLAEAQRLTHTGSGAWRVADGEALYLSEEWYRIYGFDPKQGLSAWNDRLRRMHPEDRAKVQETKDRAIDQKSDYEVEHRILLPDGALKHTNTVGRPVLSAFGDVEQFVFTMMDITERKRAEEALRRSEGYLARAQSLTQSGSWAWNVHTGARFWSQETFRLFEYDPEKVKPTWLDILERTHPEDRAAMEQQAKIETTRKEDSEFDWRIVLPDGRIKHLRSIAHPVLDESGEVTEIVGTLMDVTERKRAEALRDGESGILEMIARDDPLEEILEKLVRVVEAQFPGILCSVLLLDEDGQHVRHGAAPSLPKEYTQTIDGISIGPQAGSCGTAMYRREPVVVTDILEDPLWEAYRDVAKPHGLRACWSTPILAHSGKALGSFAMYYREPRSPSPAETRALQLATHLAGIAIERKLTHEQLRRSEAYLAEAQKLTHTGSWVWDVAETRALHLSDEWYRVYGFDPNEGISAWNKRLLRIHPDDRAGRQQAIDQAIRERADYEVEYRIILPDGAIRHIRSVGHPVLGASANLLQFVGSSTDITGRRRAEEALRQAQSDLARISRVTTMGELTASLAHEVNQPIAAAVTDGNTCLRWLTRDHPDVEEARQAASRIVKDATRAGEIVSRIRMLFKKGTPQWTPVDVNELIQEMIVLLRSETTRYSISVRTELAELPQVMGDRVQLQQVLMNLILNSIDAMKDMDGPRELILRSQRSKDVQVLISVSDTGIGLPPQHADQIFNAFFTTKPHGTGMGLRISRSIVESHGGRLWADNNLPCGAIFHLSLPTTAEARE
jgi:PAS domain S-box-containing protein